MELVADANIIISGIISMEGKTSELLFSDELNLFSPEWLLEEIKKHKEEILAKSKLAEVELDLALALIFSRIKFVPFLEFKQFLPEVKPTCPDPNDIEYLALAFKLGCSIWSDDKKLKKQDLVKIISTSELLNLFRGF